MAATWDDASGGTGATGLVPPGPARWFMEPPNATTVVAVLRAVGQLLLVVPLYLFVLLVGPHPVASWPAVGVGSGLLLLCGLALLGDVRHLRRGAFADFRPWSMVLQIAGLTGVGACTGVAFGLHHGALLLATCVPCLAAPVAGGTGVVAVSWLVLVAAMGAETGAWLRAGQALSTTVLFCGAVGLYVTAVHRVIAHSVVSREVTHALADLAASTGTLRRWPADLRAVAPQLAVILSVDRYEVATRHSAHRPDGRVPAADGIGSVPHLAFSWPESAWGDEADGRRRLLLAGRALALGAVVHDESCWAVPATADGPADVVLLVPFAALNGHPVDTTMAATAASLLGTMFERSALVGDLVDLAFTDDLTGLANRRRLTEALRGAVAGARRTGRACSVAVIDLDRFKDHNDAFGHASGDELLRRFAHLLEATVAPTDLAARLGGDEFCVVMIGSGPEEAASLTRTVHARWGAGETGGVSMSAGVATWPHAGAPGRDASDDAVARDLLRRADASLYAAKSGGRDRVVASPPTSPGRPGSRGARH